MFNLNAVCGANQPLEALTEQRDVAGILKHIEELERLSEEHDRSYDNTYEKVRQAEKVIELIEMDKDFGVSFSNGLIYITPPNTNKSFAISVLKTKWKQVGKSKWYWYKSLEQLLDDYLLK